MTMGPVCEDPEDSREYFRLTKQIFDMLSEKYGFYFVDIFTPLFDESTGEIYSDYTSDGVHLTPIGYSVFTGALTPVLEKILENKK